MKKKQILIDAIEYETINECLAVFFDCKPSELKKIRGFWEWKNSDGSYEKEPVQKGIRQARRRACWGFVRGKKEIHYFIRKRATMRNVIDLFAHELGHMERPHHRSADEEYKANRYSVVAISAYAFANELLKSGKIRP